MNGKDLSDYSMLELFRMEVDNQIGQFESALPGEDATADAGRLERLMRAAHSVKGAARMVGVDLATRIAHALEDHLVAAQRGETVVDAEAARALARGAAQLRALATRDDASLTRPSAADEAAVGELEAALAELRRRPRDPAPAPEAAPARPAKTEAPAAPRDEGRTLRISAERLERLTRLSGESLMACRALERHLGGELRRQEEERQLLQHLDRIIQEGGPSGLPEFRRRLDRYLRGRRQRREQLEQLERRLTPTVEQLHQAVMDTRMRPFADIAQALPPLVEDLARRLGKSVELILEGRQTRIDREILERLATPLKHLIQNALDHGVEPPEARVAAGKPPTARITVGARHRNGRLEILVQDDGRGIDRGALRERALARRLVAPEVAERLADDDWLEFLFMPGFSTREEVTELSGRGVGLDVVRDMAHALGGELSVHSTPGEGTRFLLALPLTLALARVLLVDLAGVPHALPTARVERLLKLPAAEIDNPERPCLRLGDEEVPVLDGERVLELGDGNADPDARLVLLGDGGRRVALRVGGWRETREVVLQTLDPGLGKIPHVFAAAQMDDGAPLLVLDVDDLLRSSGESAPPREDGLRVLVADDSLTVRSLLQQVLSEAGYRVDLAEDGADAWSALHTRRYDLLLTDVDMPRLDGIELVRRVRGEARLKDLPVIILSYKGSEQDRRRGLEAGADRYLTKSEFEGRHLLQAVGDLIGEARP